MSEFLDRILLQLSDPSQLLLVLNPAADASRAQLRALLDAAFTMDFATIHDVRNAQVVAAEFERPITPQTQTMGTWTQTSPTYTRTDVRYERSDLQLPVWVDVSATISLTLLLEVDSAHVASIVTRDITNIASLSDFRSRFQFLDVDAFMRQLGISTFEELRDRHQYLLAEFHLAPVPAFDPNDPANLHAFTLGVAVLVRDSLDVGAALRDAKLARAVMQRCLTFSSTLDVAEVRTPYAPVVVFPQAALAGAPFTADAVRQFFGAERILALFVAPN